MQRTLGVGNGEVFKASSANVISSCTHFVSVYFIAKDNVIGYVGTIVGSAVAIWWLADRNRRKLLRKRE